MLSDVFRCLERENLPAIAALGLLAQRYKARVFSVAMHGRLPLPTAVTAARLTINAGHTTSTLGSLLSGVPTIIFDYGSGTGEVAHCCNMWGASDSGQTRPLQTRSSAPDSEGRPPRFALPDTARFFRMALLG